MNPTTLVIAYYRNPRMLQRQYTNLKQLSHEVRQYLRVIIIDDGSPEEDAAKPPADPIVEVYRVLVDVRWNQDACRNLGVSLSQTPWLFLCDMDHLVTEEVMRRVIFGKVDQKQVLKFARIEEPDNKPVKPAANMWFLHRDIYLRAGGYDERFSGLYGTDADFRDRVNQIAKVEWIKEAIVHVPPTVIPDSCTPGVEGQRKTDWDRQELTRITAERAALENPVTVWKDWPHVKVTH